MVSWSSFLSCHSVFQLAAASNSPVAVALLPCPLPLQIIVTHVRRRKASQTSHAQMRLRPSEKTWARNGHKACFGVKNRWARVKRTPIRRNYYKWFHGLADWNS